MYQVLAEQLALIRLPLINPRNLTLGKRQCRGASTGTLRGYCGGDKVDTE